MGIVDKNQVHEKDNKDTLQSPDQICDHLRVTYVPTYLLAMAVVVLVAAFIVWGFLGNVSDKAYFSGVVFPAQGTTDVTLPNKGVVRSMMVRNGDSVRVGQTVALVSIGDSHSFLTSTVSGLVITTSSDYLWTVLRLSMTRLTQFTPGELAARYTTISKTTRLMDYVLPAFCIIIQPILCCYLVMLYNWKLGLMQIYGDRGR